MGEKMVRAFVCERCEHTWVPVSEDKPRVCPKCKSPYWDRPRRIDSIAKDKIAKDRISKDRTAR